MPLELPAAPVQGQGHGLCLQEQCWLVLVWESLAVGLPGSCPPLPMQPPAVLSMDLGMSLLLSAWIMGLLAMNTFKPFLTLIWDHHPPGDTELRGSCQTSCQFDKTNSFCSPNCFTSRVVQKCQGELLSSAVASRPNSIQCPALCAGMS